MKRPSYKTNDPKGWCGDPKRGAALGRPSIHDAPRDQPVRLYLKRQRWVDGDYDENGTYFGAGGGGHIYWYANREGTVDAVQRAGSRKDAKAKIREHYPHATFVRWKLLTYVLVIDTPQMGRAAAVAAYTTRLDAERAAIRWIKSHWDDEERTAMSLVESNVATAEDVLSAWHDMQVEKGERGSYVGIDVVRRFVPDVEGKMT
jgi:hypothetical protein